MDPLNNQTGGNNTYTQQAQHTYVYHSPILARPKASVWSTIARTVFPRALRTGARNLALSLSGAPYYEFRLNRVNLEGLDANSVDVSTENLAHIDNTMLQELGSYLYVGRDKDGNYITRDSEGLDNHLRAEFTHENKSIRELVNFAYILEAKKNELLEAIDGTPTRAQRAQLAGIDALIRSHENLIAEQVFGDASEATILELIPKERLQRAVKEKHAQQKQVWVSNPRAFITTGPTGQFAFTTEHEIEETPVKFKGADYLRLLPRKALVDLLLAHKNHTTALDLAEALPYQTDADYKRQQYVLKKVEADTFSPGTGDVAALDLHALANLDETTLIARCNALHQTGEIIPGTKEVAHAPMDKATFKVTLEALVAKREALNQRHAALDNQIRRERVLLRGLALNAERADKKQAEQIKEELKERNVSEVYVNAMASQVLMTSKSARERAKADKEKSNAIHQRIENHTSEQRKIKRATQVLDVIIQPLSKVQAKDLFNALLNNE